ncbi:MAG: MBL fold metallo-hydrolase, partial [Anaerolineaceae bacterium]
MTTVRRLSLGYNNIYLLHVHGTHVVVDTGPDYLGAEDVLIKAARTAPPDMIVATHGHLDHAGLAQWWQGRGVPVSLGSGDEHFASVAQFTDAAEFSAFERYV